MTVKELITALEKEPNKDKQVKIYPVNEHNYGEETLSIIEIDYSIDDRLDINCVDDYGRLV